MDEASEVRDFLMSRRARIEPEDVGLPRGVNRRVAGLRRGEAAALAGVSVEYYARLERGAVGGASDAVLDGVARALRMDAAERDHLYRLAGQAGRGPSLRAEPKAPKRWRPDAGLQWMLDSMDSVVAMIGNGRTDLLAWNTLGGALMHEMIRTARTDPPNFSRFIFLEPVAQRFYRNWERSARVNVAQLRTEAGRDPHNKQLHDLVGELSTRSDFFRELWGQHNVWQHQSGDKRYHHHIVGDLDLHFNGLELVGQPGIQMTVCSAEPGSIDADKLDLLGSWWKTSRTEVDPLSDVTPGAPRLGDTRSPSEEA